ncbi:hypothetical protein V8G54_001924 [Vigna mungo]|uniref:Uncharacterized protein n=1 Tax=Vigna mungo TaxID=3915 RepID=A0AAQ3P988_VIGMU
MHCHRWDLVPQLSIFLLPVSYGNKLELLQIHQLHDMSSPEGCLCCGFLSLGTWSLHSSSNKHVMRPKLENFVALLKIVPHPVTSRLALKWFQLLYVIIFLSILEGGKKWSGIWNYAKRSTKVSVQIEKVS